MEPQMSIIEKLFERSEVYARQQVELYKLKIIDKSADVISTLTARLVIIVFIIFFFFILDIGVALWIGERLGKVYYGFFAVAGCNAFIGLLLYAFKNKLIKAPLRNSIVTEALN